MGYPSSLTKLSKVGGEGGGVLHIITSRQDLKCTAKSLFSDVHPVFIKLTFVCVSSPIVANGVPELLDVNGWESCRCSESSEECGVFKYIQSNLKYRVIMGFVSLHIAVTFPDRHPLIERKDIVIRTNRWS